MYLWIADTLAQFHWPRLREKQNGSIGLRKTGRVLADWMPTKKIHLFDRNSLYGTFIRCLLGGIFELRRHLSGNNFSNSIAHPKNLRAGFHT
jgi:hypothetical protein